MGRLLRGGIEAPRIAAEFVSYCGDGFLSPAIKEKVARIRVGFSSKLSPAHRALSAAD